MRKQKGGFPFESSIADILFWIFISLLITGMVLLSLWLSGYLNKPSAKPSLLNLTSATTKDKQVEVNYRTSGDCSNCDISFQLTFDGGSTDTSRVKYVPNTSTSYSLNIPTIPDIKNLKVSAFIEDNTTSTNTDVVTIDVK